MQESGNCENEVKKRVQEGWNGWRKVLGVICDRRLPAKSTKKSVQFSGKISNSVWTRDGGSHKETSGRDKSCRDENVEVCYRSDEKRQD